MNNISSPGSAVSWEFGEFEEGVSCMRISSTPRID